MEEGETTNNKPQVTNHKQLTTNQIGIWSGNSNNGSRKGDAKQTTAGKMGKAFEFDGDGDYINVGNDSYSKWAFSAWINPQVPISVEDPVYGIYSIFVGGSDGNSALSITGSKLSIKTTQIVAFNSVGEKSPFVR